MSGVYNIIFIVTTNIKLFILFYLSLVFFKALYLNLSIKHSNENSNLKLFYKLKHIIINVKNIVLNLKNLNKTNVYLIIKIFIVLVFLRLILRSFIYLLLNNDNNTLNNIISVLLSLTFILYFSNLIIKYFKKDKYTYSDFYLYNSFVIKNVNIYNILYIVGANYIITNYNKLLITTIIIILFSIPVIYIFNYISRYDIDSKYTANTLKAALPDTAVFLYLGSLLKTATENAYEDCLAGSQTALKNIIGMPHEENGIIKCYRKTFDKDIIPRSAMNYSQEILLKKIEQTPIIRIAYEQMKEVNDNLKHYLYRSLNIAGLFVKGNLNVSIIKSSKDNLFVTLFFKDKGMYMPNFYHGDWAVKRSLKVLGENLNVDFIKIYGDVSTMIIMTPAEITQFNILKIFRPDIYYSDLKMAESDLWKYINMYKRNSDNISKLLNKELSEIVENNTLRYIGQTLVNLGNEIYDKHSEKVESDNKLIVSNVKAVPCPEFTKEKSKMFYLKRTEDQTPLNHGILSFRERKLGLNDLYPEDIKGDGNSLFQKPFRLFKSWDEFSHVSRKDLVYKAQSMNSYGWPKFLARQSYGILIEGSSHEYFFFEAEYKEFNYWAKYNDYDHVKYNIFSMIDLDAGQKNATAEWNYRKIYKKSFSYYDTGSYEYGEKSVQRMREKYCKLINQS